MTEDERKRVAASDKDLAKGVDVEDDIVRDYFTYSMSDRLEAGRHLFGASLLRARDSSLASGVGR